jgi:homogentisate 1,2-dioxygenase
MSSESTTEKTTITSASSVTEVVNGVTYSYQTGFGNELASEILPGALPLGRNTPKQVPYNLYTEQLSGTAFTAPRATNKRTWLYRIQPSVALNASDSNTTTPSCHNQRLHQYFGGCNPSDCEPVVDPCRWNPMPPVVVDDDDAESDFINSLKLMCHAGDPVVKHGLAIYQYSGLTKDMDDTHMVNADGDFLFVPSTGTLQIHTELGRMTVAPTEIAVIPRGIVFQVNLVRNNSEGTQCSARGYVLEICTSTGFQLPELGPIGSNGLANARDFLFPVAWCAATDKDQYATPCVIVTKMHSELFSRQLDHSPYNVMAWHGNYLPYKYDLKRFCAVNSVTYDHLDPSLYTVLTCPSGTAAGTALADFVIFPPRVMATDSNTLRPPWFHRNCMSEYMGLIYGQYDAKNEGFRPGGASLHNCMTPHGPDTDSYEKAVADPCETPVQFAGGMAFMFETCLSLKVSPEALNDSNWRDMQYAQCWQALSAQHFTGWNLLNDKEGGDA